MVRIACCLSALALSGCVTERIIERPVPIQPPSLCLTDCPYSTETPVTNGDLALQWRERGEALQCYAVRMQCVRELASR
jgi:hypothetical protein